MKTCVFAAMSAVLFGARDVAAQTRDEVALMACRNAAINDMRGRGAESVRISPGARARQTSRKETSVAGDGDYVDRARGGTRRFTYECVYRKTSGKTRVTVQIDSAGGTP